MKTPTPITPAVPAGLLLLLLLLLATGCTTTPPNPMASTAASLTHPPDLPEAVASFGAVTHNGAVYVCGGYKGERHSYAAHLTSGALYRLPLQPGATWEVLPAAAPAQGAPLVAHGRHLYRVGGMIARNAAGEKWDLHSMDTVDRFDLRRGSWESLPPLPAPRSSHDAVILDDALYIGGGWQLSGAASQGVWQESVLRLNLSQRGASWESIPQPFQRRALALAALDQQVYCIGGIDADGTSSEVDILHLPTRTWSKGPELPRGPMKGFGCSAIAHQGRLFVSGLKGDVWALSPDGLQWSVVGTLQHPRFFHRLVPGGPHQLLALGGEDSDGKRIDVETVFPTASGQLAQGRLP